MKKRSVFLAAMACATLAAAAPVRVALMDFDDQTGQVSDQQLGGTISPGALAAKGVFLLSKDLLGSDNYALIDRRDFMDQMQKLRPTDSGKPTPTKPSFIQAAQALRADVVLRGSLLSFSTGKQVVDQGGYKTDFSTLSIRVGIEALDAVDGSVVAMAEGSASGNFRQTKENYTVLSEDDALNLFEKALKQVIPQLDTALATRVAKQSARPKVKFSIKTSADPALIEIDGILVGSSPMENLELYQGDHVLTVGKPGYRDITKRILFEKNTSIDVPMLRTELSAEEMKDVLEKSRLNLISTDGIQPALIIQTTD